METLTWLCASWFGFVMILYFSIVLIATLLVLVGTIRLYAKDQHGIREPQWMTLLLFPLRVSILLLLKKKPFRIKRFTPNEE